MAIAGATQETLLALDNDVLTDWRNQRPIVLDEVDRYRGRHNIFPALASMTVFEARYGFERRIVKLAGLDPQSEQSRSTLERIIRECGVLDLEQKAAAIAAHIFARLSQSRRNRHWRDIFIAATALAHGHGVATRNQADFELIGQHLPAYAPTLYLAIWKQ